MVDKKDGDGLKNLLERAKNVGKAYSPEESIAKARQIEEIDTAIKRIMERVSGRAEKESKDAEEINNLNKRINELQKQKRAIQKQPGSDNVDALARQNLDKAQKTSKINKEIAEIQIAIDEIALQDTEADAKKDEEKLKGLLKQRDLLVNEGKGEESKESLIQKKTPGVLILSGQAKAPELKQASEKKANKSSEQVDKTPKVEEMSKDEADNLPPVRPRR